MDIDWGSGDVFNTIFFLSLWLAWVAMVVVIFIHIFRDRRLGGVAKALWAALLLLFPIIGVLLYLCFRGAKVGDETDTYELQRYDRDSSLGTSAHAQQIGDLARLRNQGVITQAEFESFSSRAPQ